MLERRKSLKVSSANKERKTDEKGKKEIRNSLLSHTSALAIAVSQKKTRILQIVWLKNTMLNKAK